MKKLLAMILLMVASVAWAGKPNPTEYPLTVHVVGSDVEGTNQRLVVVVDGKRLRLSGTGKGVLALGDYKAKTQEYPDRFRAAHDLVDEYVFLLPDGAKRTYTVEGMGESE